MKENTMNVKEDCIPNTIYKNTKECDTSINPQSSLNFLETIKENRLVQEKEAIKVEILNGAITDIKNILKGYLKNNILDNRPIAKLKYEIQQPHNFTQNLKNYFSKRGNTSKEKQRYCKECVNWLHHGYTSNKCNTHYRPFKQRQRTEVYKHH